jgi:hypothetical protein
VTPEEVLEADALRLRQNAARLRQRKARRARGLCWYCSEPAMPGATLCLTHLDAARDRQRVRLGTKPWAKMGRGRTPYPRPAVP